MLVAEWKEQAAIVGSLSNSVDEEIQEWIKQLIVA